MGLCGQSVDIESGVDKAKTGFIDYVNPRLKVFNKPLFLALIIFLHTMIVCLIMLMINVTACEEMELQKIVPNTCSLYERLADLKGNLCIMDLSVLDVRSGIPGTRVSGGRTGTQPCFTTPGWDEKWCDGSLEGTKAYQAVSGGYGECPYCAPGMPKGRQDVNVVMNMKQSTCLGFGAAAGAALGWAGMVEFVVTICYVTIFMKMGVVSMKGGGYLGDWVRSVVKENAGNIKELAGEAKDVAEDVIGNRDE
jgi:hypothetical protein